MKKEPMPYVAGAIRRWLMAKPELIPLLHGGKITTRNLPDPLLRPHLLVATTGHVGNDPMLRRLIVQVTPWAPDRDVSKLKEDPDETVWKLAATVGELLGRAKNQIIDDSTAFSATWLDGPVSLYDTKRGEDRVYFYAPVRFQVHIRHR